MESGTVALTSAQPSRLQSQYGMLLPMSVNVLEWLDLEHCLGAYFPAPFRHIEADLYTSIHKGYAGGQKSISC